MCGEYTTSPLEMPLPLKYRDKSDCGYFYSPKQVAKLEQNKTVKSTTFSPAAITAKSNRIARKKTYHPLQGFLHARPNPVPHLLATTQNKLIVVLQRASPQKTTQSTKNRKPQRTDDLLRGRSSASTSSTSLLKYPSLARGVASQSSNAHCTCLWCRA